MEIAEARNDGLGISDPVLRKYNVMAHVREYYGYREGSAGEHYQAVKEEQGRLSQILAADATPKLQADNPSPTAAYLLGRLRKGLQWLTTAFQELDTPSTMPQAKVDTFLKGLDTWVELEALLRSTHGYEGCVMGEGQRCTDASPVSCDWCCEQRTH